MSLKFLCFGGRMEQEDSPRTQLVEEMRALRQAVNRAYTGFNGTDDGDLIEAYVYEMRALQSRYSYLLRQVRQMEETASAS